VKGWAIFAAVSLVIVAAGAWLLGLIFAGPDAQRAVMTSAAVAWVVQLCGFAAARTLGATNVMAGWGLGILLRLATLAIYALVIVEAFALPAAPALLSLAAFFFASTLIEPLLLETRKS
jgi:hypothetical protein